MDFSHVKKVYFIGIGGIGMSATAGIASEAGFEVFGTDSKQIYSPSKDVLDKFGIDYKVGYNAENIKEHQADVYVVSAGEDSHNPEVAYVVEQELPYTSFPEFLYYLSRNHLRVVVTGTHGKSTTAGLLGHLLRNLDDSSFMTGAVLTNYGSNFYHGKGHYFVFEGDEYKSLFDDPTPKVHYYKPDILVLNNLEFDHPDVYENLDEIRKEFQVLIDNMPDDGLIIYNADDVNLAHLVYGSNVARFSFSLHSKSDFVASKITYEENFTSFTVTGTGDKPSEDYQIAMAGELYLYNALAAIATLRSLGFKPEDIAQSLKSYTGVKRRFEVIGTKNNVTVIDDYAHHPTAVRETLNAAKLRYKDRRIWAIFEPHTFSRTKATLHELTESFGAADEVLIAEIYAAREGTDHPSITSQEVIEAIKKNKSIARLVASKTKALDILKKEAKSGDVVIVMAVGSFNRLAYEFLETL